MSHTSLKLIFPYFERRAQRTKINDCFSKPLKIYYGVLEGSLLVLLFFSVILIDIFSECEDSDIENYADDTTAYPCTPDINSVISKLQSRSDKLSTWFKNNHMKANPGKCNLLLNFKTPTESCFGGFSIKSITKETLLGVWIDSKFRFVNYNSLICTKVSRKINALSRIANFISYGKRHLIMKVFIESGFNYCSLMDVAFPNLKQ